MWYEHKSDIRAFRASVGGTAAMAALLFGLAGTFAYWQAWLFMAVFVGSSAAVTVYLAMRDPVLPSDACALGQWRRRSLHRRS